MAIDKAAISSKNIILARVWKIAGLCNRAFALAALAATSAFAQSSVTLFGVLDLGLGQTTRDQTVGTATASTKATNFGGINSGNATNQLGVRGTEDLGGGLTAGFVFGWSINPSNVANNGNLVTAGTGNGSPHGQVREANISLSNNAWGRVVIGSQNTSAFAWSGAAAALQNSDIGGSFYATLNGVSGNGRYAQSMLVAPGTTQKDSIATGRTASRSAVAGSVYALPLNGITGQAARYENMLSYVSPSFNGFSAGVSYFRTDSVADNSGQDAQSKLSGNILRLDYSKGPLEAHYAYTAIDQKSGYAGSTNAFTLNTGANPTITTAQAAAVNAAKATNHLLHVRYNLGMAEPWLIYTNGDNKTSVAGNAAASGKVSAKGYEIGVRVPVGAFNPYILMGRGELTASGTNVAQEVGKVEVKALQAGVKYSLSKRSTLWGGYGYSKFDTTAGAYKGDKDHVSGFRAGVTHSF